MSIVKSEFSNLSAGKYKQFEKAILAEAELTEKNILEGKYEPSNYAPTDEERKMRSRILKDFVIGTTNMWTPRVELNDLAVIQRLQIDQFAFNTYQANNGEPLAADDIQGWHSNAMRPVVRNKCISIAAHATARLIFPKVFAYNENSDEERDAAQVMEDLMEWAADQSNYRAVALRRVIAALYEPASIGYTEYGEVLRRVKTQKKADGSWDYKVMIDEILSGFQDYVVPTDELYIENFYENDIQKQGFLIWRRVIPYSLAEAKYGVMYPNFHKYVRPGVQNLYSDTNQAFYYVYDPNMRQNDVEEIIYFNKALDVKIIMVNGVMLTDHDNPNPRLDKLYPFDKFGYELINNRCFYYKSLAFKMMQDANIANTLYPMIIDATYLEVMKPTFNTGGEFIASDVIVPGANTTLADKDAQLRPVFQQPMNITAGLNTLQKVEESLNESSQEPLQQGQGGGSSQTAYEISRLEQNANTVLGLFLQMIAQHVRDFGKLRLGDVLQYLTIADVDKITDNTELVFKTFLLHDKQSEGGSKTRKIKFDGALPDEIQSPEDQQALSLDTMIAQGGPNSETELYRVNPTLFRNLKYEVTISPDVLNPRSTDLERAYHLEMVDRLINNPLADQQEVIRLLLQTDPLTKKNPDKYIAKQQQPMMSEAMPKAGNSPLNAVGGKSPLPQTMSNGIV